MYGDADDGKLEVTDQNWHGVVVDAESPVLVWFAADWCARCRQVGLVMDDLTERLEGIVKVIRADVDGSSQLVEEFGVHALPTLLMMTDGHEEARLVEPASESDIIGFVMKFTEQATACT